AAASVGSARVKRELGDVAARIERAVPHVRVASFASTGDRAFVAGRTTFVLAYPHPTRFGQNPEALRAIRAALDGRRVAGAPVHVTGFEALNTSSGQKGGLGILAEALLGGLGALLVLAFVF